MEINGVELSFDVTNPDDLMGAARFIEETRGAIAGCKDGKFTEMVPDVHRAVSGCFDRLYGPGVGAMVCGERTSGIKAVTAVCEFMEEYFRQMEAMEQVFGRTASLWERIDRQAETASQAAAVPIPMKPVLVPEGTDRV